MSDSSAGPVPAGGDVDSIRGVLRNRSFRNLLLASVTSSMGDWIGLFALIALAETLGQNATGGTARASALAVSFVMIARITPTLFIAPVAGVFVDRWDRKRTMVWTDVVRGGVMFLVPFVGDAFQLVIATFVIEVAAAMFIPAKDAVVPTIVPKNQLTTANQLSLVSTYSTLPIGALLCAVVIGFTESVATPGTFLSRTPEAVPIALNAFSFFASIIFIRRMEVPVDNVEARASAERAPSALQDLRDGFAFIAGMPIIRALIIGVMAAFLAAGAVIGVGTFFATITNSGEAGFATLGFIVGTGLVAGIGSAGWLAKHVARERIFAPGIVLAGLMLVVTALMPTLLAATLPALIMGFGSGTAFITGYTLIQLYSKDAVRGRIFATFNTAIRLALFATLVAGPLMILVLGVERTQEQIDSGEVVESVDQLEDSDPDAYYPYQIGGVRITLMTAGGLAALGAAWSWLQISGALRRGREREQEFLGEVDGTSDTPTATGHGLFIVFEGGEGAGKSTQMRLLRAAVERHGVEVVVTREPGGTPIGEAVRELLLDPDGSVVPRAEALLYSAARAQHVAEVIQPALDRGAVVLCDRYVDSSIVYQGVARGLGVDAIVRLNEWATAGLLPDLTVLLDVDAKLGLERARSLDGPDRLESEGLAFHETVNEAFRKRARLAPERTLVVDAAGRVEDVHATLRSHVEELLGDRVVPEGGFERPAWLELPDDLDLEGREQQTPS